MQDSIKIKGRMKYSLTGIDLQRQDLRQQQLTLQIKELALDGISTIHFNQRLVGQEILKMFSDFRDLLMVLGIGYTQSGKTGTIYSCIEEFTKPSPMAVPIENIFIITGLSSTEWKIQTKERIPDILKKNVFHRPDIKKRFSKEIKEKKNVLIMIDEIQIACGKTQTISKEFEELGLLEMKNLLENDIKIIEFSATPNGTLHDSRNWKNYSKIVPINPGEGYTGCIDLRNQNRIREYHNLCDAEKSIDNIKEIQDVIKSFKKPMFHFIRTKKSLDQDKTIGNFKKVFGENADYMRYNSENSVEVDIDCLLSRAPKKDTFIFLKEFARCAKTFKKDHIGIWYERYTSLASDDVIIQGLLGRATGYDDNGISIVFTNPKSIDRYEELWNTDFSENVEWRSNTTSVSKEGITRSKGTFHCKLTDIGEAFIECNIADKKEPKIMIFKGENGQIETKEWYKNTLAKISYIGGRGPNKRKCNEDGFYESNLGKGIDKKKVRSCQEIFKYRRWNHTNTQGKRFQYSYHPCYEDINDKSTLEWWFIYYEE